MQEEKNRKTKCYRMTLSVCSNSAYIGSFFFSVLSLLWIFYFFFQLSYFKMINKLSKNACHHMGQWVVLTFCRSFICFKLLSFSFIGIILLFLCITTIFFHFSFSSILLVRSFCRYLIDRSRFTESKFLIHKRVHLSLAHSTWNSNNYNNIVSGEEMPKKGNGNVQALIHGYISMETC